MKRIGRATLEGQYLRCCLCSKTLNDVALLVTSERGLSICDECVDVCTMLVAEGRIAARAAKEPTT